MLHWHHAYDAYSVKPLAKDVIKAAAQKNNHTVVTVEESLCRRRDRDAVAGNERDGIKVHKLAGFANLAALGKAEELLAKYGIDAGRDRGEG